MSEAQRCHSSPKARYPSAGDWSTETELVDFARDTLPTALLDEEGVIVTNELAIGRGAPDLVMWRVDPMALARRQAARPSGCSQSEVRVLQAMHLLRPLRVSTIAHRVWIDEGQVRRLLGCLVDDGLARQSDCDCYVRTDAVDAGVDSIVSVEAKLKNWRTALTQAYRNTLFADQSYVVLDANRANGALNNIDMFRRSHIGLCVADAETRCLATICRPNRRRPKSQFFRMLAAESFVSYVCEDREVKGR